MTLLLCNRYMAIKLPMRYRKMVTKTSIRQCLIVVACLWTVGLVTFIAPLFTKANWTYYTYNANQKMCGIHWEYPIIPSHRHCR